MVFCGIHGSKLKQVLIALIHNMCLEITLLKFLPHFPGVIELS